MLELIFILIALYAVYAIRISCAENKETGLDLLFDSEPTVTTKKDNIVAVVEEKPVAEKAKQVAETEPVLSDGKKIPSGALRNPETGEEVKMANSYHISKRWIKDALVTEGLLDKIYKTGEVDGAKKIEINLAFAKLLQLDKYK